LGIVLLVHYLRIRKKRRSRRREHQVIPRRGP
jgi:hypothetical protein